MLSLPRAEGRLYRLCDNYTQHNVCNWVVRDDDPNTLCQSCRLTRVIPDLSRPGNKESWYKLEVAKRRLVYTLLALGCPVESKDDEPHAASLLSSWQIPWLTEHRLCSPGMMTG